MKKIYFLILLLVSTVSFGQLTHSFQSTTQNYNDLTGFGINTAFSAGSNNSISGAINIGFDFEYDCQTYSQLQICSEGWIGLGTGKNTSSNNNLSGSNRRPLIAPLWDNIRVSSNAGFFGLGAAGIRYQQSGVAPNRVFSVEYDQMRWLGNSGNNNSSVISFTVRLYEGSNIIEFNYRDEASSPLSPSASIGLAGNTNGDFISVSNGGVASTTFEYNVTSEPIDNRLYRFTPAPTCAGIPNGGTASTSNTNVNCNDNNRTMTLSGASLGCGVAYQWQYSNDNTSWFDLTGETNTTYTTNIPGVIYYRCVVTCVSTGLSANSTVVAFTSPLFPPNDLPCNATGLTVGAASSGTNICASNNLEPAAGNCWSNGSVNTVWYTFVAPASGSILIKTIITSSANVLQSTQMALYSGTCNNLSQLSCDVNADACGGYTPRNSEISSSGLSPGATYYVSVDGQFSATGDFAILAIDGNSNFPLVQGQDCALALPLCNATTTVGNPGYQAVGGVCDHNGSGNCTNGEANSVWYTIKINPIVVGTQRLTFDIVPNDYGNPNPITGANNPGYGGVGSESDYDFVLWKTAGANSTTCAGIQAGGVTPAACNYSPLGLSGTSNNGNAPGAYNGFNGSYEQGPIVSGGDEFILVIQNFTNSTSGFTLEFPTNSPVVYDLPTTVFWSGGNFDNNFNEVDNWGGCASPVCARSAVVTASSVNQPVLEAGVHNVNDLTINSGASLTLDPGAVLKVCGNFTNNGSLNCAIGSTIEFVGTGTQTITGAFENNDAFYNFTVDKLLGTVVLANNIDVDGDFLTSNMTSVLNTAARRVRVEGNFTNAGGNTTYSNTGTNGSLIFKGAGAVTFTQGTSQMDLNDVTMIKTGGGSVTLTSDLFLSNTGNLLLTSGNIITGAFRVDVSNGQPTAVNAGNAGSYIVGNLYRTLNGSAGSYDFPLGTATNYERANVTFTTTTTIPRLLTRFDTWTGAPNTIGLTECLGDYALPAQNMGVWSINASANSTSGTYDMTLYSTGATNTGGSSGWTIQKASSQAGPWIFNGVCALSSVSVISRTGMNGFSVFGVAQSITPLPVELLEFYGYRYQDVNILKWTTVSEINSDYFDVEKSRDGINFEIMEKVKAQGNSNTPFEYAAIDDQPGNSITYYRLNFFDFDGSNEYSKTIAISREVSKELKINSIFPNPGKEALNVEYSVSDKTDLQLSLTDAAGRTVIANDISVQGNGVHIVNTQALAEGIYIFTLTNETGFKEVYNWVKK